MVKFVIIFLVLIVQAFEAFCDDDVNSIVSRKVWKSEEKEKFLAWKLKFGKSYESEAREQEAMDRVLENLIDIEEHNRLHGLGLVTHLRSLGKYSDRTAEETNKFFPQIEEPMERSTIWTDNYPDFPEGPIDLDWRNFGFIGPVKEQGMCGACWAFCAIEITYQVMRKRRVRDVYSPQQLIDCNKDTNFGCTSGWPYRAMRYVRDHGIASFKDYPYVGTDTNECSYNVSMAKGHINEVFNIPTKGNETWLRDIVASAGPISVMWTIDSNFYDYASGVYYQENCSKSINHAMILVGYGHDPRGGDYWIVKNSWGEYWGDKGFAKVARNRDNMCNIAYSAAYAT